MESMVGKNNFWKNKKVLITGHTGFKGSWLALGLCSLGANVVGLSKEPAYKPNIFTSIGLEDKITSIIGDINDKEAVKSVINTSKPEIIFHLAAQPLVRLSYDYPIETFQTNIIGTANVLYEGYMEDSVKVVVNITTDKCYENKEWLWPYREDDALGGYDPYSASKAASEIVTSAMRRSYYNEKGKLLASVRAGNVIGGGDWSKDRIVPDIIRGIYSKEEIIIRNKFAIRPFQHVLEPLSGYLKLAERLWNEGDSFAQAYNFGPDSAGISNVYNLAETLLNGLEIKERDGVIKYLEGSNGPHEANILKLDSTKASELLKWKPKLDFKESILWTAKWYKAFYDGEDMLKYSLNQINEYSNL